MLLQSSLLLLLGASVLAQQDQVVLGSSPPADGATSWSSSSSSLVSNPLQAQDPYSPRVFNAVWGFLNSFHQGHHPQGRAIVPGVVKKGTLLYHGRGGGKASGIDWFAFDAELSYGFASRGGRTDEQGEYTPGTMWTYAATQDLKVVYFDGWSALKWRDGVLELQDKLVGLELQKPGGGPGGGRGGAGRGGPGHGPPEGGRGGAPERGREKREKLANGKMAPGGGQNDGPRATRLCELAAEYGFDGFIRQEGIYELIACDMEKNVEPVAVTNITKPNLDSFAQSQSRYSGSIAESRHLLAPESRIHLFPEYSVSLYDPKYVSLRQSIHEQSVFQQRLTNFSDGDVVMLKEELGRSWYNWEKEEASGVDWSSIHSAVADRWDSRLYELKTYLEEYSSAKKSDKNITLLAERVRKLTYGGLMPFLDAAATLNTTAPTTDEEVEIRKKGFADATKTCHYSFTGHISNSTLNEQERRLKSSLENVLGQICAFTVNAFASSVVLDSVAEADVEEWTEKLAVLMDWLDWPTCDKFPRQCTGKEVPVLEDLRDDGKPQPGCVGLDGSGDGRP